jgi:hypothetical protein
MTRMSGLATVRVDAARFGAANRLVVYGAVGALAFTAVAVLGWRMLQDSLANGDGDGHGRSQSVPAGHSAVEPRDILQEESMKAELPVRQESSMPAKDEAIRVVSPLFRAQIASVHEAARTGTHPERLSPQIAPKPFDLAAWTADPQSYLAVVEPARVFQSLAGGAGVPMTVAATPPHLETPAQTPVVLRVRTAPLAPVTYTTFDGGIFENTLNSITVRADQDGFASVTYTPTAGVIADTNILASSPMAAMQVHFVVQVGGPARAPDDEAAASPVPHP